MKDLLIVLNPREIEEAITAFRELPVDKLWLRGMREADIAERWDEVMDRAKPYDRLYLVSDDVLVRPTAFRLVQDLLYAGLQVATAYCNLSKSDLRVNLCSKPLRGSVPIPRAYTHPKLSWVMQQPTHVVHTHFTGMCVTGMTREMWQHFGFECYQPQAGGYASDFMLSKKLQFEGVSIYAHREAFCWHLKERWNQGDKDPRMRLMIGPDLADIVLERA